MVVSVIGFLFLNFQVLHVPWILFAGLGVLVGVTVLLQRAGVPLVSRSGGDRFAGESHLSANDAFDRVQQYLDDREGKKQIDPYEETYDLKRPVLLHGRRYVLYSIIGKEKDTEGDDKQKTIRVIWDCKNDEYWGGDDWVPGENRRDPFYEIEKLSHSEGNRGQEEQDQGRQSTNVYVNSGKNGGD